MSKPQILRSKVEFYLFRDAAGQSTIVCIRNYLARETAMIAAPSLLAMDMVKGSGENDMTGYNAKVDGLREAEYPMLKGRKQYLFLLDVC